MFCDRNEEIVNKEGRHVGLDFYDLLIEALTDAVGQFSNE